MMKIFRNFNYPSIPFILLSVEVKEKTHKDDKNLWFLLLFPFFSQLLAFAIVQDSAIKHFSSPCTILFVKSTSYTMFHLFSSLVNLHAHSSGILPRRRSNRSIVSLNQYFKSNIFLYCSYNSLLKTFYLRLIDSHFQKSTLKEAYSLPY